MNLTWVQGWAVWLTPLAPLPPLPSTTFRTLASCRSLFYITTIECSTLQIPTCYCSKGWIHTYSLNFLGATNGKQC